MKTLRLVLIAAIISFSMVSFSSPDHPVGKVYPKVIHMDFEQAIQNPEILSAMHEQIDVAVLVVKAPTYTFDIIYSGYTVCITGTNFQWVSFLKSVYSIPYYLTLWMTDSIF